MALFRMAFFVIQALFSSFRVADFVIPSFGQALFRLFVVSRGVISSFCVAFFVVCLALFRLFAAP